MRKKLKYLIIVVAAFAAVVIIKLNFVNPQNDDSFFVWSDGYVAAAAGGDTVDVAFTVLSNQIDLDKQISSISFSNNNVINIQEVKIEKIKRTRYKKYRFYGVTATIVFDHGGEFSTNEITVNYYDGESKTFKIGDWFFEGGPQDGLQINTWESPVVASNSDNLTFDYSAENSTITSCTIYTGISDPVEVEVESDQTLSGKIDLSESKAPIKYIRTKIAYSIDGEEHISYGVGCYCGSMEFTEDDIMLSYEHCHE